MSHLKLFSNQSEMGLVAIADHEDNDCVYYCGRLLAQNRSLALDSGRGGLKQRLKISAADPFLPYLGGRPPRSPPASSPAPSPAQRPGSITKGAITRSVLNDANRHLPSERAMARRGGGTRLWRGGHGGGGGIVPLPHTERFSGWAVSNFFGHIM